MDTTTDIKIDTVTRAITIRWSGTSEHISYGADQALSSSSLSFVYPSRNIELPEVPKSPKPSPSPLNVVDSSKTPNPTEGHKPAKPFPSILQQLQDCYEQWKNDKTVSKNIDFAKNVGEELLQLVGYPQYRKECLTLKRQLDDNLQEWQEAKNELNATPSRPGKLQERVDETRNAFGSVVDQTIEFIHELKENQRFRHDQYPN